MEVFSTNLHPHEWNVKEIENNLEVVATKSKEAYKNIDKFKQLNEKNIIFERTIVKITEGLQSDFATLQKFIKERKEQNKTTGTNKKDYDATMDNIRKRNVYFEEYLAAIEQYNKTSTTANKLLQDMSEILESLQKIKYILGVDVTKI